MIPDMLEIHGNILLDVTKHLKLKFNPLFEKPRRPNLHRFDKFVIWGAKSFFLQLVNSKITFHFSKRLVQSHVQYCKKQMSWQAQYNKEY